MPQALQDTDACILMQFDAATEPLRHLPNGQELNAGMLDIGKPYLARLLNNGHQLVDALGLLRATFRHTPGAST